MAKHLMLMVMVLALVGCSSSPQGTSANPGTAPPGTPASSDSANGTNPGAGATGTNPGATATPGKGTAATPPAEFNPNVPQ